jgi:hypothetical protein
METFPEIDIFGGAVVSLPDFSVNDHSGIAMTGHPTQLGFPDGATVGGFAGVLQSPQLFLGRTDTVRYDGWTDELKVLEHHEFFWRAWGVSTTVYDARWRMVHARKPFDRSSVERIDNLASARDQLRRPS